MFNRAVLLSSLAALSLSTAAALPAAAQDAPPWNPGYADRFLQSTSPLVNEKGILQAIFTHRFNEPVNSAGGSNLFGLDSGANIGLGLGYVPLDRLSLEAYRASTGGDYEFAAKYAILEATRERPVGLAVRAGMDWLTKFEIDQKTGWFVQASAGVTLGDRVTIAAVPTFVSNTPLYKNVFNVPVILQVKVAKGLYATGEYVFRNKDLDGSVGQWSFAVEKSLWLHRFGVWIGNSAASTVDQIMAGDYGGGVKESNIRLGFNIIRGFEVGVK